MRRRALRITLAILTASMAGFAAEQTWTGQITSAMCNAGHMGHDCIVNCIKAGEKYVFVTKGQVHKIQNQDFGDLEKHAGHTVKMTGTLGVDGTVTVTTIAMPSASHK